MQCSAAAAGTSKQASKQYEEIVVRQKRGRVRVAVALFLAGRACRANSSKTKVEWRSREAG